MCQHGREAQIHVIRRNNPFVKDGWHPVFVDACIADYVQAMNARGIMTLGCCCGHEKGEGSVLVDAASERAMIEHGYAFRVLAIGILYHAVMKREEE